MRIGARNVVAAAGLGWLAMAQGCAEVETASQGARRARLEASPQWRDGRFQNPLERRDAPMRRITWAWLTEADANSAPSEPLAVAAGTASALATDASSALRITWLGHASLLVELDGARVLLDPVWKARSSPFSWLGPRRFHAPPLALDALPPLDAVVISHDHYDHLDEVAIAALKERAVRFVVPLGVGAHLERWGVPAARIAELDWWQAETIGGVTLTATPARHFSGRSVVLSDRNRTLWAGWAIRGPRHAVYYAGDTAMFPGLAEIGARLGPFDAALVEVGAYDPLWRDVHLGPEQAVVAAGMVRAGLLLPVHWATFDLALHGWTEPIERTLAAAARAGVPVAAPRPGEPVEPHAPPPVERWWPELPWRRSQEHPMISSGLPAELEACVRRAHGLEPALAACGPAAGTP